MSRVTSVTLTVLEVTVTEHVAVFDPSAVVTVIVAEPALTAVTFPLLSTVAVPELEELQLTDLLVALEGAIVAVRVSEPPSTRLSVVLLRLTPVTATVVGPVWPPPLPPEGVGSSFPHPEDNPAIRITANALHKGLNNFLIVYLINN